MPGPGELPADQHAPIIGREAGLARLRGLVDQVPLAGQVLLVTGEAGMGKTVLLADAADRARSAGSRVLSVTGRESESRLAFAGLHQLLRPVLSGVAGLPGRQAQALAGALGLAADPVAPDPLLTGVAVLTLLSDLSERSPVLVVADDAQWLDRSSLDALAFVGSRLDAERVVLLVGARGQAPPAGFDRGFPELHLEPLSAADSGLLLDGQPRPPRGRARHFDRALADPAGDQWPFERAQLRLDYGEWLRRRRRINDAKPVLTEALRTFRRLGARSWAQRAQAELRACGVAVAGAPAEPDALARLTPQQRQIARLASDGLTDREIGDRLFLSPRTVSSHLHRSYPKLGVAGRHQLRDVIGRASTPAPAPESAESRALQ